MRDKVIQTENDYDKDVFNGDVGIVERVDLVEQQVVKKQKGTSSVSRKMLTETIATCG